MNIVQLLFINTVGLREQGIYGQGSHSSGQVLKFIFWFFRPWKDLD